MSRPSGTAEQILSLPKGGGAIQGLGEKFQPDLHTGTGSYTIPIDIPNGPNDIGPKLTLLYHTSAGNGLFGMGFSLNLFTITRSTDKRIPTYTDNDLLVLAGGGELVDLGAGKYNLKVDANRWQIERDGEGFRITDREGKRYKLGVTEQARLFTVRSGFRKILSWYLEEIEDPLGNKVNFIYRRDSNQLYLEQVNYSIYTIRFKYEERADTITNGRAGFIVTTKLRCNQIELLVNNAPNPVTRRWELEYKQSKQGNHSLLYKVKLTGFDETGKTETLPILTLSYTEFLPGQLERFGAELYNAYPGALIGGQRDLIDWNGNGLPDLLEIAGGRARVWYNLGNCTWSRPSSLEPMPTPITLNQPGVAFADMDGNGTADLIMLNQPLAGYYPHTPTGGFERPIFWHQTPEANLSNPNTRLTDLNGDGIIDLLVTGDKFFSLYYRDLQKGWQDKPSTIPRPSVPPVSFSDPYVHLADMNGDGLQDIVKINGGAVTYWPYLGNGQWAEHSTMQNPPSLPLRFDPKRIFLTDIDGDGCADIIYVDFEKVIYWINQSGNSFSQPKEIAHTPPAITGQVLLADMKGTGTAGILWSSTGIGPATNRSDYFYLDLAGNSKPYLLTEINNGMGLVTKIDYGTSTQEAARDKTNKSPWTTFLPFPLPIVKTVLLTDQVTNRQSLSRYHYHNGHFDGTDREFAGFEMVEIEEVGEESAPTMLTRNWHHLGLDPANLNRQIPMPERYRLRALRGKILKTEVYGLDGNPDRDKPYYKTENIWNCRVERKVDNTEVLFPYLSESKTSYFERQTTPYRVATTRNISYDTQGNVTEQEQTAEDPRDPTLTRTLHTTTTYATNPSGRFTGKTARVVQKNEIGETIATTISYYDGLSEGQVGDKGLLTRQEILVLTDDIVAQVYGDNPPDYTSLGYHRRPGETGWWINQVTYTRNDNDQLTGTVTNGRGHTIQFFFDKHKIHPVKVVDELGNSSEADFDYRANKLQSLTDTNGATIYNYYDPLGRLIYTIEPGANETMPTTRYTYSIDNLPVQLGTEQRANNNQPEVINRKVSLDGFGQVIEERITSDQAEIVERYQTYSTRGTIKAQFLPFISTSPNHIQPDNTKPHIQFQYDAIGRLIEIENADGSTQKAEFKPGAVLLYDEEDTRADINAHHPNTPTKLTYDPTGRVLEASLNNNGQWISTRYKHDAKNNLVEVIDPAGHPTRLYYDSLGRRLRLDSPSSGTTLFVFDANGNQVEKQDARGEIVSSEFDELDRIKRTFFPATGQVSAEYTYHDSGRPPPPESGNFTKGRIVKVTHQGGEENFDYDALGRVTKKAILPTALPGKELTFNYTYRADGQRDTVTYPALTPGSERLKIKYEYNQRGFLTRIPDYIKQINYNLAGQRLRIDYENNVSTEYSYDPLTFRLKELLTINASNNLLQHFNYTYDHVGNLLSVNSPDPKTNAEYIYDNLYRLKQATTQSGKNWTYQYDDLNNLIFKSDYGNYQYDADEHLISVGQDTFTYTPAGHISTAPWGQCKYDPIGHLTSINRGLEQMNCTYDHMGHRVRTEVVGTANPQNILTPDDMISIENGTGFAYILDGTIRVAQIQLDNNAISYLHGDHLGSTTLVTGITGQTLQKIYYDPFGAILENIIAGNKETHFLYSGQMWDAWAGLLYLSSRYYNPKIGRFITPDTIVPEVFNPLAWNRYSYVQNNPLRYIDPTGHFWKEIGDWFSDNWKYIVAAIAIVAVAVLTVVTFGWGALIAVGIGMAIGGAIGGISAYQAGGDILLGILVGMAVGGAAAYASLGIGAGVGAILGKGTLLTTLATGTLSGAVSGAAMGFVAGFAGGQGTAGTIFDRMWKGAIVGAIVGFAFSFATYGFQHGWFTGPKIHTPDINYLKPPTAPPTGTSSITPPPTNPTALVSGTSSGGYGQAAQSLGKIAWGMVSSGNEGFAVLSVIFGQTAAPLWQVGLTTSLSGVFTLDWADDIWKFLVDKDLAKGSAGGKF